MRGQTVCPRYTTGQGAAGERDSLDSGPDMAHCHGRGFFRMAVARVTLQTVGT